VSQVKRGICPVCTVEMLLRIVQQSAPSTKFQDQKPVYFWIYPTYFFTTETARIVRQYIRELRDLFIPELRQHLQKNGFTISSLLNFEASLFKRTKIMLGASSGKSTMRITWRVCSALQSSLLARIHRYRCLDCSRISRTSLASVAECESRCHYFVCTAICQRRGISRNRCIRRPTPIHRYALGKDRFRVDELSDAVIRLLRLYDLHLDVFGDGKNLTGRRSTKWSRPSQPIR